MCILLFFIVNQILAYVKKLEGFIYNFANCNEKQRQYVVNLGTKRLWEATLQNNTIIHFTISENILDKKVRNHSNLK